MFSWCISSSDALSVYHMLDTCHMSYPVTLSPPCSQKRARPSLLPPRAMAMCRLGYENSSMGRESEQAGFIRRKKERATFLMLFSLAIVFPWENRQKKILSNLSQRKSIVMPVFITLWYLEPRRTTYYNWTLPLYQQLESKVSVFPGWGSPIEGRAGGT